ncbi:MAG: NUDIX domain-containing protein [Anaerolineae bacterium]|nr:NUDIX domain-containing protein [Anaerolineae bacterium]
MAELANDLGSPFCPKCGGRTIRKVVGGRERDTCPDCGYTQYTVATIGIGALVFRGDSVLLVERGIPPVGIWTVPSGFLEQDDDITSALVREVKEETALDVTNVQGIVIVRNTVRTDKNDLYVVMLCDVDKNQQPEPDGRESTQARFVPTSELDTVGISEFSRWIVTHYLHHKPTPMKMITIPGYRADAKVFGNF